MVKRRALMSIVGVIVLLSGVVPGVGAAQPDRTSITAATVAPLAEIATLDQSAGDEAYAVAFSPDGTLLATGAHDGLIRVWDASSGTELRAWKAHDLDIYALAFKGTQLASGGWDGHVRLWDTEGWYALADFRGHNEPVYGVAFHPLMPWLASAGGYQDNTVRVWDADHYFPLSVLRNHYDWVTGVAYSPNGHWLASSCADGSLRVWGPLPDTGLTVFSGHTGPIGSVAWSPDSTLLATGSLDGTIRLWDAQTGQTRHVIDSGYVWQVAFSPDGSLIAAGGRDGVVTFWDVRSGEKLASVQAHPRWVNALAFSPDGTLLATAGDEGIVKLWGTPGYQSGTGADTETIEDIALRIHLHNARSTDLTIWPGGYLGTNIALKPVVAPGDSLKGLEFPGLGSDQAPLALDDLKRPTLIHMWASWCGPCVEEFPLIAQLALASEDHAYDVVFVDAFEDEKYGLNFLTTQPEGLRVVSDPEGKLAVTMGTVAIPISILIDEHQNVIAIQIGNYTSVQAALFEILARNPGAYTGHFDPTGRPAPAHFVEIQPVEEAAPLEVGQMAIGTITDDSVQTAYTFEGHAGDVISVRMDARHALEPYVVLLTPEGEYLAESSDFLYETHAQVQDVTLPEDGAYTVVATRYMGALGISVGNYVLTVTK
jgi:WD40 repeat protein/thiol-disulfide isomerase/thioredoxin